MKIKPAQRSGCLLLQNSTVCTLAARQWIHFVVRAISCARVSPCPSSHHWSVLEFWFQVMLLNEQITVLSTDAVHTV